MTLSSTPSTAASAIPRGDTALPLPQKLALLETRLRSHGRALVTYSGGVDSAFLLAAAVDALGDRVVALTALSASYPPDELAACKQLAADLGVRHVLVDSREVENPEYAKNPANRCYYCKSELLQLAVKKAAELELGTVLLGTNIDDLGDHRPGLQAAAEHAAQHPLVEAGLTKEDIRQASRARGLPTWDKPAMPCLSSRFPYGTRIDPSRLGQVGRAEAALRVLGFRELRVRFHEEVARIELPESELGRAIEPVMRRAMLEACRAAGFRHVTLDLGGLVSGGLNAVLRERGNRAGDAASTPTGESLV